MNATKKILTHFFENYSKNVDNENYLTNSERMKYFSCRFKTRIGK